MATLTEFAPQIALDPDYRIDDWRWGIGQLGTLSPGAEGLVTDKFNEVKSLISDMTIAATTALNDLSNLNISVPQTAVNSAVLNPVTIPNMLSRPSIDTTGLTTTFPTFTASPGTLLGLPTVDTSGLASAIAPADVDAILSWTEQNYSGGVVGVLQTLITKLQDAPAYAIGTYLNTINYSSTSVITPSALVPSSLVYTVVQNILDQSNLTAATGYGADAETAIYDRAKTRLLLENAAAYQEIDEYFTSRGFSLPTGAHADRLQEQLNRNGLALLDINEKIIETQAEILNNNRKFIDEFNQKRYIAVAEIQQKDEHAIAELKQKDRHLIYERETAFNLAVAEILQKDNQFLAQLTQKSVAELNALDQKDRMFVVETYQKGLNFAADATKALEGIIRDYESGINARALDYAKASAANVIQNYAEKIKGFMAKNEANKIYMQTQTEILRHTVEYNKGTIAFFGAHVQAYLGEIEAIAKKNEAIAAVADVDAKVYDAETRSYAAYCDALVRKALAEIQAAELDVKASIANAENSTQGYIASNNLAADIAKSEATVTAQILASALGSVNASAGISDSYGRSHSETYSHTESRSSQTSITNALQESHGYSEV